MADVFTLAHKRYVARRLLARRTVLAVRKAWRQIDSTAIRASWVAVVGPAVYRAISDAQSESASGADAMVAAVLAAQGVPNDPAGLIDPAAFTGVASDGRDLLTLLELSNVKALMAIRQGQTVRQALSIGQQFLELVAGLQVTDAGRVADGVAVTAHHRVDGAYRALTPPSCSRCVVLAGKWYRWDAGFERHPRCDCFSIAADDGTFDDHPRLWSPKAYFASISEAEQDRIFGVAGAKAIRDGADMSQVVNARSGMSTASIGGRNVLITNTGTTRRGYFAYVQRAIGKLNDQRTSYTVTNLGRYGNRSNYQQRRISRPRLMPEQIYRIAGGNRDEAIRLLAGNGYLVQGVQHDAARALMQ